MNIIRVVGGGGGLEYGAWQFYGLPEMEIYSFSKEFPFLAIHKDYCQQKLPKKATFVDPDLPKMASEHSLH